MKNLVEQLMNGINDLPLNEKVEALNNLKLEIPRIT